MSKKFHSIFAISTSLLFIQGVIPTSYAMLNDEDEKEILKYGDAKRVLNEHEVVARYEEVKAVYKMDWRERVPKPEYNSWGWNSNHSLQTKEDWRLKQSYLIENCYACREAQNYIDKYDSKKKIKRLEAEEKEKKLQQLQKLVEEKKNIDILFLTMQKEITFLKRLETDNNNLKERISSLVEKNDQLHKVLAFSSENPYLKPIIIPEDCVTGQCTTILLKKDPKIFLPWSPTKDVYKLMSAELLSGENAVPSYIRVEDKQAEEGNVSLLSYLKEKIENGLDAEITLVGKSNFKKLVSSIECLQNKFWTGGKAPATVSALINKLNEKNGEEEWVAGWSELEENYKKYTAATVLYKINNSTLPKKYEDIKVLLEN